MSVLFFDGFDLGVPALPKWDTVSLTNGFTADSGRRGAGTGALDLTGTADNVVKILSASTADIIIGIWIKSYQAAVFLTLMEGATVHITVEFGASPTFFLIIKRGDGTVLHTDADSNSTNTEGHYFEIRIKISDTVGVITANKNGAEIIALTAQDTRNGGAAGVIDRLKLNGTHAGATWFDDLYVLDAADAVSPTTFLGSTTRVDTLDPDADETTDWTPSTGTTHYDLLDETPNDGDTSYVESGTLNARDLVGLEPLPYTPTTVYGVQVNVAAKETVAGSMELAPSIKISTTHYAGTAAALGTGYAQIAHLWKTNPATAIAWTKADVNALLAGAKLTSL